MSKFTQIALVTGLALVVTSTAQAGCLITARNNATKDVPLGTCLYMGSAHDFAASAQKECGGFQPVHEPTWNDEIVKIGTTEPASVSLMMGHVVNADSMTMTFEGPAEYVLEPRFSANATIMYCY